ncbi:hypothetical protein C8Q76DRAFT_794572 [Earliella scabrosa]|nr:hypothetical protein C8Q76DRAFT_794572 [Earliella scabrosa]
MSGELGARDIHLSEQQHFPNSTSPTSLIQSHHQPIHTSPVSLPISACFRRFPNPLQLPPLNPPLRLPRSRQPPLSRPYPVTSASHPNSGTYSLRHSRTPTSPPFDPSSAPLYIMHQLQPQSPAHGHSLPYAAAPSQPPTFNPDSDPRSLISFFEDFEYCFDEADVQTPREKKPHSVRGGKLLFSIQDLDMLVAMTVPAGIRSIKEFNEYSRNFRDIATLLTQGRDIRQDDRDFMFLQGLPESLRAQVLDRLRMRTPQLDRIPLVLTPPSSFLRSLPLPGHDCIRSQRQAYAMPGPT